MLYYKISYCLDNLGGQKLLKEGTVQYFHLGGNVLSVILEGLFQKLPCLVWLGLWYNRIRALPPGISYHRQLKTLLLEKNPRKELPTELYGYNAVSLLLGLLIMNATLTAISVIVQSTGSAHVLDRYSQIPALGMYFFTKPTAIIPQQHI